MCISLRIPYKLYPMKMADDDMFGDSELFEEFDKERETSGSFIIFEKDDQGGEDRSKFVFQVSESSSSSESEDDEQKLKVKEKLKKDTEGHTIADQEANGQVPKQNGFESDSDSDDNSRVVSRDRQAKMTTYKLNFERILYLFISYTIYLPLMLNPSRGCRHVNSQLTSLTYTFMYGTTPPGTHKYIKYLDTLDPYNISIVKRACIQHHQPSIYVGTPTDSLQLQRCTQCSSYNWRHLPRSYIQWATMYFRTLF